MKRLIFPILIFILVIFFVSNSYSKIFDPKSTDSHGRDFCECIGIDCAANSEITEALKVLSDNMDNVDKSGFYRELKEKFGFNRGKYTHRILFHWGFNDDPRKSTILRERVEASVDKSVQKDFYLYVLNEQIRRNKKTIRATKRGFGVTTNKKAKALTTILYDVHILGDYSCPTCTDLKPLCSMDRVKKDIMKKGIERLFPYSSSRHALVKKLDNISKTSSDKEYAAQILIFLKEDLPPLLSEHSENIFYKEIDFQGSSFDGVVRYIKKIF